MTELGKTRLIAFIGRQRAGKNLAAEIMRQIAPDLVVQVAFADRMREALYTLNPPIACVNNCQVYLQDVVDRDGWDSAKEDYQEVRRLLQRFGTEMGRNLFGEDFWLDLTWPDVTAGLDAGKLVVITDARFRNELERIRDNGGLIVRIDRADLEPEDLSLPRYKHSSEKDWREWNSHHVITNYGDPSFPYLVNLLARQRVDVWPKSRLLGFYYNRPFLETALESLRRQSRSATTIALGTEGSKSQP